VTDRGAEDAAQLIVQAPRGVLADRVRPPQRVDARRPQRLVHVDVPESRDRPLVEQQRLDLPRPGEQRAEGR